MPNENSVSKKAVKIVMDYEIKQGRKPKNVSNNKKEIGYDFQNIKTLH